MEERECDFEQCTYGAGAEQVAICIGARRSAAIWVGRANAFGVEVLEDARGNTERGETRTDNAEQSCTKLTTTEPGKRDGTLLNSTDDPEQISEAEIK